MGCVMEKYKELLAFPGVVLLVVGAVAFQMVRTDAVALPNDPPAVVKTLSFGVIESAHAVVPTQTGIDPI